MPLSSTPPEPTLDDTDRRIVNALQGGFPLTDEPYRDVAATLGIGEEDLIARLQRMLDARVLTRFGPMFQVERMGGAFVLAALAVPESDYESVAEQVNALPAVAHNYRREHALNMWFVLATETPDGIAAAIAEIERRTGLPVYAFPKEREYFVEMKLHA
jgi:DNA-binding Lrp family transcriptional regulator